MSLFDLKYIINSFLWNRSQKFRSNFAKRFFLIEDDSHWQIMHFLSKKNISLEDKKYFIEQAIDERNHATIFKKIHVHNQENAFIYETPERSIYYNGTDSSLFIKYCQIGEKKALEKFIKIHKYTNDLLLKKSLHQIIKDETVHSGSALKSKEISPLFFWYKYKYLHLGTKVASQLISVVLFFIFIFCYLPLVFLLKLFKGKADD